MNQKELVSTVASVVPKFDIVIHINDNRFEIRVPKGQGDIARGKLEGLFPENFVYEVTEKYKGGKVGAVYTED